MLYEIPLSPTPQVMTIALGASVYRLRFFYANSDEGGWVMDIADKTDVPLVCGVPLVTKTDLLAQYAYLGIEGGLYVFSDGDPGAEPTYANLGVGSHLYFAPH